MRTEGNRVEANYGKTYNLYHVTPPIVENFVSSLYLTADCCSKLVQQLLRLAIFEPNRQPVSEIRTCSDFGRWLYTVLNRLKLQLKQFNKTFWNTLTCSSPDGSRRSFRVARYFCGEELSAENYLRISFIMFKLLRQIQDEQNLSMKNTALNNLLYFEELFMCNSLKKHNTVNL